MDPIAVRVLRGGSTESVHRAGLAVADARGRLVASFGDPKLVTFLRSAAKPMQAVALVESGAADRFGFGPKELAISCGSHSGEPVHTALVEAMLARIGLTPDHLRCGPHAPYDKAEAERLGKSFTNLHNNCSGKHAGMLAVCVHKGWDVATYLDPSHPLQAWIRNVVAQETHVDSEEIRVGVDGCGVPCFAVPLRAAAGAYARLARPEAIRGDRGRTLRRLRDAMLAHPDLVAGTHRLDTDFMRAFPGRFLGKVGGEAVHGAALPTLGLGVLTKVHDGNYRALGPILWRILEELGVGPPTDAEASARHVEEPVRNVAGRPVGELLCDVRLKRRAARVEPVRA